MTTMVVFTIIILTPSLYERLGEMGGGGVRGDLNERVVMDRCVIVIDLHGLSITNNIPVYAETRRKAMRNIKDIQLHSIKKNCILSKNVTFY